MAHIEEFFMHSIQSTVDMQASEFQPGMFILGHESGTYPGFLRCDGSLVDPALYPSLVGKFPVKISNSIPPIADEEWIVTGTEGYSWSPPINALSEYNTWQVGSNFGPPSLVLESANGLQKQVSVYGIKYCSGLSKLVLSGSDDGTNWMVLDQRDTQGGYFENAFFRLETPASKKFFQLSIANQNGSWGVQMTGLKLYSGGELQEHLVLYFQMGMGSQSVHHYVKY